MYQIIGADGRVYGPVSSEQTRRWMAEGRVNAQTRVQEAGATEWKTAAEFPELGLAPAAGLPEPGQEREANFMSDSIRELVQKGRLRERCAEPVQWTCAVCGTDTADNTQPCGVCCGTEFKPRCVRCDAVGVPGGERACESVAQYRLTGRMAFNDEPPPPPAAAKYPFRGRISKVVRAKNGAPRQLALHRKGGTDQRRINLDGGSLLFKAGRKVPHEDLAEGQTLNGLLRKDDGGQEWLVKAMVALEGRESEEAPPPPHPGNLWKCPECGTPTAAPGAAGAECPACLKTVRPLQANASPPPPPIGANLIWGMIDQCD